MADLNGDGRDDAVSYDPSSGHWVSHLNRAPGQFTQTPGVWAAGAQVVVGDLDGDGRDDVFLYDATTGQWRRQLSDGQGGFSETSGTWSVGWTLTGRR